MEVVKITNRLVSLRNELGLTQKEFAKRLGITRQMLSLYEIEARPIPSTLIVQIATTYKVSTDYLLGISSIKNIDKDAEKEISILTKSLYLIASEIDRSHECIRSIMRKSLLLNKR
jgi:transcriptional regulator with XRE-family HTH domain